MALLISTRLFSWNEIEARSDLDRFYLVRDNLPDEEIIAELQQKRGNGRDDYPVRAMWNALLAGVVFQHESIESLIRELSRNPALLEACGFDSFPQQKKPAAELKRNEETSRLQIVWPEAQAPYYDVPCSWNFSRFLSTVIELEEKKGKIAGMMEQLVEQLMEELPDFGQHLGYDGKAVNSYSTAQKDRKSGQTSDPDADWGKHETTGIDSKTGKPWKKVKSWFGYGLHLIADTRYEIPVSVHVTAASCSEQTELRTLLKEAFEQKPKVISKKELPN